MKRFCFFSCLLFLLSSCASTTPSLWSIEGSVTAYNMDGSILRQWDNVIIESGYTDSAGDRTTSNAIKAFGINFTDPETRKNVIISNAVPCIIEYGNVQVADKPTSKSTISTTNSKSSNDNISKIQRRELEKKWISEIKYDIINASSEQDMLTIKNKIEKLSSYNNNLSKKNHLIIDALNAIQYEYKQKAKKLGTKL